MSRVRLWYRGTATPQDAELDQATLAHQIKPLLTETMAGDIALVVAADGETESLIVSEQEALVDRTTDLSFTLDVLPESLQICGDVNQLRHRVTAQWGYAAGDGCLNLPIVWTQKGPLYGEVIGQISANDYRQPVHLGDRLRQPLYRLGQQLITDLGCFPRCYLLQFDLIEDQICFDRLWPFPTRAALASIGIQEPDLFTCHGFCLRGEAIYDLRIGSQHPYYHPTDFCHGHPSE